LSQLFKIPVAADRIGIVVARASERDKFLRLRCRSENQLALVEGHDFVAIAVQLQ
jgi:hypothetical protein